jgi:hypothetical protein
MRHDIDSLWIFTTFNQDVSFQINMSPEKDMLNYIFNLEVLLMSERMKVNEIYDSNVLI